MSDRASPIHLPVRTCVVCNSRKPKAALWRLALDPNEKCVVVDRLQKMDGRGAYVCPSCLPRLRFNKRVQKAFRTKATQLFEDILQQLPTH